MTETTTVKQTISIPALCRGCGHTYDSGFYKSSDEFGRFGEGSILDCTSECPRCGMLGRVANVTSDGNGRLTIESLVQHLRHKTVDELRAMQEALKRGSNPSAALDEFQAVDGHTASMLRPVFVGQNIGPNELVTWLIGLLTLLIMYQTMVYNHKDAQEGLTIAREALAETKRQSRQAELEAKIAQLEKGPSKTAAVKPVRGSSKRQRNCPCPCGSGAKFKVCHGTK